MWLHLASKPSVQNLKGEILAADGVVHARVLTLDVSALPEVVLTLSDSVCELKRFVVEAHLPSPPLLAETPSPARRMPQL